MRRYYNIQIDTNVTNFTDGADLLCREIKKLHSWERISVIKNLLQKGLSQAKIAKILGVSPQSISQLLKQNPTRKEDHE
ncbi:helix-turn-helix domain-containing protein [bacterium]|nr:helix-turn-helix domain-containing protein [bacterium]